VPEVILYSKDFCPFCTRAKALLERKGVEYTEIDVIADPEMEQEMIRRSGGRTTAPQIFIDGHHVGGSDDLHELDANGELDPLLHRSAESEEPIGGQQVEVHEVVILGSGPAGLTAAIYCARANLKPVVVEGLSAGGQLMNTTDVENYPGFPEGIMGPEMMDRFRKQAERFGALFEPGDAVKVDFSSKPFGVWTDSKELRARAVIIATGASPRTLGIPGEEEYAGRGVSYCATCDGFFFRDQEIVVVGGGDSAMEEALFLAKFGSRVSIIHRRDQLRASKIMGDRALAHEKIEMVWDSVPEEVVGDGQKVTAIKVRNVKTGEVAERPCGGFFVAIGHTPNTALFENVLPFDDQDYLLAKSNTAMTEIPGVFMAGDVHDHVYRQAITAAGAGCKAAIECERWLESEG
jgi:thioredoxin reductase (NADPH)